MANPSLQIGNSNWAIKEDDLLGYSTVGTNYLPKPITITRASAGTRTDKDGLVNYAEIIGGEEIEDGDFPSGTTDWSFVGGSELTVDGARINNTVTGTNSYVLQILTGSPSGKQFVLTYDVITTNGTTLALEQASSLSLNTSTTGINRKLYFTWDRANDNFVIKRLTTGTDVTIDNVSVKESTRNDLARVDYTDGTSSLLVEPERTNKVTYSETYGSGTFFSATSGSTIDNTTSMSPSGDTNATQVTSTGAGKIQSGTLSLTQNTDYVLSFYAKNVDATLVNSRVYATGGSGGTNLTSVDYTSQLSTTEWTRITHIFNTGTNTAIYVYLSSALNSGGTIQLWGAQLEEGSYATSYIPNFGTALGVTRVQDQYEKTGISNLINSAEGVLFAEMAALSNDSTRKAITLSDGTTSNRVMLRYQNSSNAVQCFINVGNVLYSNLNESSYTITDFLKIAFKWKAGDFALWINGAEVATSTDATSFGVGVLTELQFNEGDGAGSEYFGKVKQLQVFKTALTDSELETLTTI